jgi:hypothetical protein
MAGVAFIQDFNLRGLRMKMSRGDGRCLGSLVVIFAMLPASLYSQEQPTWQWSPTQPYHKATVKVWQDGSYTGSGVLIGTNKKKTLGYVLTAHHVVQSEEFAGVEWKDKTRSAGKVILTDEENDLAIMTCDPPQDAVVAKVAKELPSKGDTLDHTGWGGEEPITLRTFYGQYMHTQDSTFTNTSAIEGDSGGGVWFDGQLIGIISGGRYQTADDLSFPLRAAPLDAVQVLCSRVSELPAGEVLSAQNAVPPNYFEFLGADIIVERKPEGTTVKVNGDGILVPEAPEPVVVAPKPSGPVATPPVPKTPPVAAPAAVAQVVSIDTGLIAKTVVEHIIEKDLMPPQKVDDAELVIRIAERLKSDEEFANLVASKIMKKIEAKVLQRVGNAILQESK